MSNADMYNESKGSTVSDNKERVAFNLCSSRIRELLQSRGIDPESSVGGPREIEDEWVGISGSKYAVSISKGDLRLGVIFCQGNRIWTYRSTVNNPVTGDYLQFIAKDGNNIIRELAGWNLSDAIRKMQDKDSRIRDVDVFQKFYSLIEDLSVKEP